MAEYERISAQIYVIYLRYVATEDIHVYSIDECFLYVTAYLNLHRREAEAAGMISLRMRCGRGYTRWRTVRSCWASC